MGQGRLLGLLPHGSMGYGTADLPPLCPVPPGTGVLQVCSASGTVSVAVLGAELQAQGALAEPTEVLVVVVQEQGHHSEVPQSCLARVAGGSSPLPGHSTVAQPRGAPARSHLHVSTVCQGQVCFFMPSSWGQHQRHSGETGAASPTLPQTNFVKKSRKT